MPEGFDLILLGLVLAVLAYTGAVRLFIIGKLTDKPSNAPALKRLMFGLVFADAPLVFAAILLTCKVVAELWAAMAGEWEYVVVLLCLGLAGLVLAGLHVLSWGKSFCEWWNLG